jgi:hypothetical protein
MADKKSARAEYTTDFITSDIDKVSFLGNVHLDNMMTALIAISAELWTDRRRLRVIEKLLAAKGVTTEMIEQYVPTEADTKAWEEERKVLVERIFDQFARNDAEFGIASGWKNK